MVVKMLLLVFILLQSINEQDKTGKSYFRLHLINCSRHTSFCSILGNDKNDSVQAGQEKNILFELDDDQPSFYLSLTTKDLSEKSYRTKLVRILNTTGTKQVNISPDNQLIYFLSPEEKIIDEFNPGLRTKNFWKLDSVLNKNKNSITAAEIIFLSLCDIDVKVDTIKKYYDLLAQPVKTSVYGKRITEYLMARTRLTVGNRLGDLSLPDTMGRIIHLDDIKSEYILVDFWFSRCGPCIRSFPDLQNLYLKTDRAKFEILGISVDEKASNELWRSVIDEYKLSWININDAKSSVARSLAIVNYPIKILLDRNKKIIKVDTDNSYENLYEEIEKLVNKK